MKKIILYYLCLYSALVCMNCTSDSKAVGKEKLPKALPPLSVDNIYDADRVVNYLFDNEERDTDSLHQNAKKLFLQGIDWYKNKHHPKKAIPFLKKSIALYPDAKSYHALGTILYDTKEYSECVSAFKLAIKLKYSPLGDVYFKIACAQAAQGDGMEVYSYLERAFENGFLDSSKFVNEPALFSIRTEKYYRDLLFSKFGESKNPAQTKFDLFVGGFKELEIPFTLNDDAVGEYESGKYIGYDFSEYIEEMENVSFGRDVSNEFCYVGRLKKTEKYIALVYQSVEMLGGDLSPVYTMVATYTPSGALISKKVFSCRCSAQKIITGSFDGSVFTVSEKKVIWEKNFNDVPYDENKILRYEEIETVHYTLDETGKINTTVNS